MNNSDYPYIIAIAKIAATADGHSGATEQAAIDALIERAGYPDVTELSRRVGAGDLRVVDLAGKLSDEEARRLAYETALAVCNADGLANLAEQTFLDDLRDKLGLTPASVSEMGSTARDLAGLTGAPASAGSAAGGPPVFDEMILQQAMLTGALELLPDRLANIAVLPLQLRMVYQIGQGYGQKLDADQVKDLAATMGLGVAAQAVEGVILKAVGGLLGGLLGGATRVAGGAAITFSATYALGHAASQYYAQGRRLSAADLKALFNRFQQDAKTIYPKVQDQIRAQSETLNLHRLLKAVQGR
jgi:uncharacterized protein (DUF697 family)/tellurite resistance protein